MLQVNTQLEIRTKIEEDIKKACVPGDLFDAACYLITQDMYFDSFLVFRKTVECMTASYAELT
jgi:hypothetical protein